MTTTHTFKDLAATAVMSGYKWLTSTLLAAQQQFAVRPYFTAQVIDDTIQPNAQWFSGAGTPLGQGSMAVAPDGQMFSVGLDALNNLCVFRAPDLNAVAGVWPSKTILDTTGDTFLNSRNVYSIQISDYYNGSYRICVWYFGNFSNDGTDLKIKLQYSDDGGITFTKVTLSPASLPNNTVTNLSLASFKPVFNGTDMKMGCFYIKPNGNVFASAQVGYDIYFIYGDVHGFSTDIKWWRNVDSFDWTIHSLGAYYFNDVQYCVFSGFRNVLDTATDNENYSLWVTGLLNNTGSKLSTLWIPAISILPIGSASSVNKNQFTFPSATVKDGLVSITANATLVDSLSQTAQGTTTQVVTTHTNYILIQSDNGKSFSYPTVFVGTDGVEFNNASYASFIPQGRFWYLGGALGYLWQLTQNNIVADVSTDIIGFEISETAGQPSAISLQIANANNKWVGSAPTGAGAAAIARNKKIAVWQGYYNANGVPELVPHSVYYIDDIHQVITSTKNDITLIGRDFYKKLKTTVTRFSYQQYGPTFFTDIFDGTFKSSWNQITGVWNFISTSAPPLLELTTGSGGEDKIMLVGTNGNSYASLTRVFFRNFSAAGSRMYVYAVYIDSDNWLRLEINTDNGTGWKVTKSVAGATTDIDTGSLPSALTSGGSHYYGVYVRRYDYYKWNFMIDLYGDPAGNSINDYDPAQTSYVFKNSGTGEYDLSTNFSNSSGWQTGFTVGIGRNSNGPTNFRFFMHSQFNNPNNLGAVIRRIARIAGIFSFKLKYTWRELLFLPNFTGTFTVRNRKLILTAGNQAISENNQPFSNGEISFRAKIAVTNNSNPAGFSFIFRKANDGSGMDNYYKFHVIQASTGFANPPVFCRFERFIQQLSNKTFYFYNTPYDVSNNQSSLGSLNIDMTKWHTYRVTMIDGWFYAFIDDIMVASWNDNNITLDYQTTGKWGFVADTNTTVQVQEILAPDFWKPIQVFSFNPGDDAESSIDSLVTSLRAWFFSDLLGRFKTTFLGSTDSSTYTYNTQLFQQNVDDSDKEYVSQVTVYGNGVSSTARNSNLMPGTPIREEVIVDYTILTQKDAQTRADNELINSNQFRNQYTPKQVINVGAEIFDAVTIVNTGNNTSGVSGTTRVYAQGFQQGGGNNNSDYSLELSTGNM